MCDYKCLSPDSQQMQHRDLTLLLLDCWQREYDKRPYHHFQFSRLKLEERLERKYEPKEDFSTIVIFLTKRFLSSIKLVGFSIISHDATVIDNFVRSLKNCERIELLVMDLPPEVFQLLSRYAQDMKVEELSLQASPLRDEHIAQLHSFLTKSTTLHKLNISNCNINQYNFAHLVDGIYKSPTVNSCDLSNIIGWQLTLESDKVAHLVASLIWQNRLQELVLENCGFVGQDMQIVAEYLYNKSSKLQTLNVSYNLIGADGALELLKAISSSGTLKHLKLNGCHLAAHGGELVAQHLSSCSNLQSLEIQRNDITSTAINSILLCLQETCHLQKLYLFGNTCNERTGEILHRLLDAGVLLEKHLDVRVTFDDTLGGFRVVPCLQ